MTTRDLLLIGIWTLGTAGFTLGIMAPQSLNAVDATPPKAAADIKTPTLTANGCQLSVRFADAKTEGLNAILAAGDMPRLELVAHNTSDEPASFDTKVAVYSRPSIDRASRIGPIERDIYNESLSINLKAGETKVLTVTPKAKLAAGASGSIHLIVDKKSLIAARYSVPGAAVTAVGQPATKNVDLEQVVRVAKLTAAARAKATAAKTSTGPRLETTSEDAVAQAFRRAAEQRQARLAAASAPKSPAVTEVATK